MIYAAHGADSAGNLLTDEGARANAGQYCTGGLGGTKLASADGYLCVKAAAIETDSNGNV